MRCKNCNAEVFDGELYCGECGAKIDFPKETTTINNNSNNKKKITFSPISIFLVVIIMVLIVIIIIMHNSDNTDNSTTDMQNLYSSTNSVTNTTNINENSVSNNLDSIENNNVTNGNSVISNSTNSDYPTSTNNTPVDSSNTNESQFQKDNQYAYTKYCLSFENGEIYEKMYIEIEGNNIYLFDNDQEIYLTGTYTSNNGYLVGTYTEVRFNDGGDIETRSINDSFRFEIMSDHKLRDATGYGYWNSQIIGTNNIYVLY